MEKNNFKCDVDKCKNEPANFNETVRDKNGSGKYMNLCEYHNNRHKENKTLN